MFIWRSSMEMEIIIHSPPLDKVSRHRKICKYLKPALSQHYPYIGRVQTARGIYSGIGRKVQRGPISSHSTTCDAGHDVEINLCCICTWATVVRLPSASGVRNSSRVHYTGWAIRTKTYAQRRTQLGSRRTSTNSIGMRLLALAS